jgi:hypothetical protein
MDLKEIMSISGHSGLFKFISQGRNGIIVESFTDQKRSFVNASNKVSTLEDIAIFTTEEEVPLKTVLKNIHDTLNGEQAPDPKSSPEELRAFMEKVLPAYDRDKVYVSDIKKLASWYNSLLSLDLLKFDETDAEPNTEEKPEAETDTKAAPATAPKAKKKKV